jgi:hypothetical protein
MARTQHLALVAIALASATATAASATPLSRSSRSSRSPLAVAGRRRSLQPVADAYAELCMPPIGDADAAFAIVGGVANLTTYRGVLLVSPDGNSYWDKTAGINGHPAVEGGGQGFVPHTEEGDANTAFFDLPYVTVPQDANATHVAFFVVRPDLVGGDPNGGPIPAILREQAAVFTEVVRDATSNSCFKDILTPPAPADNETDATKSTTGGGDGAGDATGEPVDEGGADGTGTGTGTGSGAGSGTGSGAGAGSGASDGTGSGGAADPSPSSGPSLRGSSGAGFVQIAAAAAAVVVGAVFLTRRA